VVEEAARGEFEVIVVPKKGYTIKELEEEDEALAAAEEDEEDDEKDVLDVMKERAFGSRKSDRKRTRPTTTGYMFNSSQIAMSEDSEA
jgi:hypothetical protein